jgi:PTH2 family peptidyl-tRNA hydrolase
MKQILVMRKDLGMKPGKLCAQAAHASMKATLLNLEHPSVKEWLAGKFTKIAVGVDSEEELLAVLATARAAGLIAELVTDAGLTVFNGVPTNTCGAVGPASHEDLQPITGGLKLL